MQEPQNSNNLDSDFRAHLDEQYESNLLGHFNTREEFKASLTKESYSDNEFGLIDGEIVLAFEVLDQEVNFADTEMVSYRNAQGGLISKEDYYRELAQTELNGEAHVKEVPVDASAVANAAAAMTPGLSGVEFTEASPFDTPAEGETVVGEFLPLDIVIAAFTAGGLDQALIEKVKADTHPDASDVKVLEGQRIFLVNRALRLAISEMDFPDTIQLRMIISDQVSADNWRKIIANGLVPAIKGTLPVKKTA